MTAAVFRRLALGMPGAVERSHHGHPDFRIDGRIFATLPADGRGMVRLPPVEQRRLVKAHPHAFEPARGAWGRRGCTMVNLAEANATVVRDALRVAWMSR